MMPINKGEAPRELTDAVRRIKGTPSATLSWSYVDHAERSAVLHSLLEERGGLCAYCMSKLDAPAAHVEHIKPQSDSKGNDDPDSANYGNMLAVCSGFEGSPAGLTCDRARGNTSLTVNPLKSETLKSIRYQHNGIIKSDDGQISKDLDKTLNLNQSLLVRNRKAVIDRMNKELQSRARKHGRGSVQSYCKKYVEEHLANPSARFAYDGALVYFMGKRARVAS